jgi:hypothetical protein
MLRIIWKSVRAKQTRWTYWDELKLGNTRGCTHCKDTVALSFLAVHLYVVIAPFLNKLDHESGLHEPRKHRVEREYHLTWGMRQVKSRTLLQDRTAKPMRVAMEELQLQDLQNIEAIISKWQAVII